MKRLALLALVLLSAGCAHNYPLNANLNPPIISQMGGIYGENTTAAIDGKDSRDALEVIVYQITDGAAVKITNLNPPHLLLTERLAGGFRGQGLRQENSSPVKVLLDVKELVAKVTRSKVLYMTTAKSRIHLIMTNSGRTLTKNYSLESNRESVTKPGVEDLEKLLDIQLSDIVTQILGDSAVQTFLNKS